ncbi:high mobility group box domain-containing protein [Mycena crocata]|nr:high mobility group box domain-containing protein [Mycena crocata]
MSFREANTSAHIARPPNSFLCFRSQFLREQKAGARPSTTGGMKDVSRQAADVWNCMSDEERRPYIEMANRMKEEHQIAHPDYKFTPKPRGDKKPSSKGQGSERAQSSRSSRRPQSSGAQRPREPEISYGSESYYDHPHPTFPTLCSPWVPPQDQGKLYLPGDISDGRERSQNSHHARSDRSDSWDGNPAQFGVSNTLNPQEMLSQYHRESASPPDVGYYNSEHTSMPFEQQQDFGSLCQWDTDFSRSRASSSMHGSHYRPY